MDVYSAMKAAIIAYPVDGGQLRPADSRQLHSSGDGAGRTHPADLEQLHQMHRQFDEAYLTRMGTPADIAACCVYLASSAGEYVTGANFILDGGLSAHGAFPPGPPAMRAALHVGDEEGRSAAPRAGAGKQN